MAKIWQKYNKNMIKNMATIVKYSKNMAGQFMANLWPKYGLIQVRIKVKVRVRI